MSARWSLLLAALVACAEEEPEGAARVSHGPVAPGISAPMGEPLPTVTAEQRATFERGRLVARHRFTRAEGLGPAFNVSSCVACHEKPVTGGSAGLYRNFFLSAVITEDGAYLPGESVGKAGGVIRMYANAGDLPDRPAVPEASNLFAQRNPIPFFGVGLLAELSDEELLSRADPEDADGDGISGRPNYDRGFVGRFGRKAQTVSIEGFIRGPLNNHAGITTDPLTDAQKAALPVDSSSDDTGALGRREGRGGGGGPGLGIEALAQALSGWAQAAAPETPLVDTDAVPDPELAPDDLFALVSFAMLLAAPPLDPLDDEAEAGLLRFDELGCADCHTPRLQGPRGPLPVYSDLLLHDMGPALADGILQGEATGSEFRTQPLWGIVAKAPYLHDGRASTLSLAIEAHGGEGAAAAAAWAALDGGEQREVLRFLETLGGAELQSPGLLPPGAPVPAVAAYGGPLEALDTQSYAAFTKGRALFDREFGRADGVGGPRLNGDSCRACHMDPVPGGAGPSDVDVMRHGILNSAGQFVPPVIGTVLHKGTILAGDPNRPQAEANIFEARQTPTLLGAGLIDRLPDAVILAQADPYDLDGDGISGRPSWTDGGRLGRFGWKAQVPSLAEFVRDAMSTELGLTLEARPGRSFGELHDDDGVPDPELSAAEEDTLAAYLGMLAPPPRQGAQDAARAAEGEALFTDLGCAACHTPALVGGDGAVPLYSDLLLHEILPEGQPGIEEASASTRELRTPPLWGLAWSRPYLHDGAADTVEQAILGHFGEGVPSREAYLSLLEAERFALVAFLEGL